MVESNAKNAIEKKGLNAYSLAGVGIGGIIGAGFFLGSGLAVNQAGPSTFLAFLLGGMIMIQVLGAMTSLSVNRPVQGSFRVYAESFLGKYIGFLLGWIVLISGILVMSSEAIASGTFLRYWIPQIPLPVASIIFMVIVIGINSLGIEDFGTIETVMAVIKILVLIIFILLAGYIILFRGVTVRPGPLSSIKAFLPRGITGFLQSMLIVIFTYSGTSTVAMASTQVKDPRREIHMATILLSIGITLIYTLSMLVLVFLVNWNSININESPFVSAFDKMGAGWVSSLMNGIILIAAFSVMIATYFTNMQMLVSLASSQEAPEIFKLNTKNKFYRNAWLGVGIITLLVVGLSFIVKSSLFNYLVSASSYFSFFNWIINLITFILWLKYRKKDENYVSPLIFGKIGAYVAIAIIVFLFAISLRVQDFRTGFYAAVAIFLLISITYKLVIKSEK